MINRTYLPDEIVLRDGTVLKPVIGGHLAQQPFLVLGSNAIGIDWHDQRAVDEARKRGLKYRRVAVLSRNLRGKLDLHGSPYRPTHWIFVEVKR